MTGWGSRGLAEDPRARLIYAQLTKECVQVGLALSYKIEPIHGMPSDLWAKADEGDAYEELDGYMASRKSQPDWRSSMAQDVIKGRRTEVRYMNGFIVERGREANTATPVNAAIVQVVQDIEAGRLKPEPENVERVLSIAGL